MANTRRFEDLEVWQLAREVCRDVWQIIQTTPLKNDFKLRDQMNASSGSAMDNIAEGFERNGNKEFRQFLSISKGSSGELRSQLYRCLDREHIDEETFQSIFDKVESLSKQIQGFMGYLKTSTFRGGKFK